MNLRIILTVSLLALVAAVVVTATFPMRESSAPAGDAGSASFTDAEQVQRAWPENFGSTVELTQEEQILLAEIQQKHDPETLDQYLNPLTFAEEEQTNRFGSPGNARSVVETTYDRIFPDFIDSLGLSPAEADLVRDAWIDHEVRKSELGGALMEGLNSSDEVADALSDANQRFQTRLSRVLSPEQIAAMREHERQVDMDFMAQVEAELQEKVEQGFTGIVAASSGNDLVSVQAYLASGANPNQLPASGFSAMHNAAANNNTEMLRALIESGGM